MLRARWPMQRYQGKTSWYTNVQCREESIHSPPKGVVLWYPPHAGPFLPLSPGDRISCNRQTESKLRLLLCAVEAPASLYPPCYQVMLTQPLNCWVQEKKGRRKRSLTSIRRRLLLPTALCTAPGSLQKHPSQPKSFPLHVPCCPGAAAGALPGREQYKKTAGNDRAELKNHRISSREHLKANRAEAHSWQGDVF